MKKIKIITMILMLIVLFKIDIVQAENIYKEYKIGDKITYNGMDFYVIESSDNKNDRVTMLKAEPLTVEEVSKYGGVGTDNNHVNMYVRSTESHYQTVYNNNGYGGMQYYASETCGYNGSSWAFDGCTTDYGESEVKYVVDAWTTTKFNVSDLTEDSLGYKTRLITYEELTNNLGYEKTNESTIYPSTNGDTPSWLYNSKYYYWTMSSNGDSASRVWGVSSIGSLGNGVGVFYDSGYVVRPVVTIKKEPIGKIKKLTDKEFKIGDIVEYNNMLFYVIKDSTEKDTSVTLLKAEPLSVDEVNKYGGVGTINNHVNVYLPSLYSYYQKASDLNSYGGMMYYSSSTCGYNGIEWVYDGCTTDYNNSEIKYVVDAWAIDKFPTGDLVEDATGYSARLITFEDLTNNLGYTRVDGKTYMSLNSEITPSWAYSRDYHYWTMSQYENSKSDVWFIGSDGSVSNYRVGSGSNYIDLVVRPVVTLKKINEDNGEEPKVEKEDDDLKNEVTDDKKHNQVVKVPDTLLSKPIIFVMIGGTLIIAGTILFVLFNKKNKFNKK